MLPQLREALEPPLRLQHGVGAGQRGVGAVRRLEAAAHEVLELAHLALPSGLLLLDFIGLGRSACLKPISAKSECKGVKH